MIKPIALAKQFFSNGQERSIKAKKNILFSFGLKGVSIIVGFLMVPISLNYVGGATEYGIWLTLSTTLIWLGYFDIGLGNGMRNKLTAALAVKDYEKARIYVSTTYAGMTIIFSSVLVIFLIANNFINWVNFLNTPPELGPLIDKLVLYVIFFFFIRFVVQLISVVNNAAQDSAVSNSYDVLANLLSLIGIIVLGHLQLKSLLYLGIIVSVSPVIVFVIASLYFFLGKFKAIRPSIKYVDFKYFGELGGLGVKFLFIQLATLVIFNTNNFVISKIFGPSYVVPYNIANKYFINVYMAFAIVLLPFWSAFTDAYVKNDFAWIRNSLNKLIKLWIGLCALVVVMLFFSGFIYKIWVPRVQVPFILSVLMGIFVIVYAWYNIFCFFINGTGKITLQLLIYILAAFANIPLIYFFASYLKLGVGGVLLANIIVILPIAIYMPLQTYKIINKKASGIWNS